MAIPKSFGPEFGLLVKQRRAARGFSLEDLSAALGNKPGMIGKSEISRLENGRIAAPHEATILRYCEILGIREHEVNALRLAPALAPKDLIETIDAIKAANRAELNSLAAEFQIENPDHLSDTHLRDDLLQKAADLRRLSAEIEGMRGLSNRIDNIVSAASQAVLSRRLSEARELLSDAGELQRVVLLPQLEANAGIFERLAEIDLFENKVDEAVRRYAAAADSFASIDPLEPSRRRHVYALILYSHGIRYGGAGLGRSIDLFRESLADFPRKADSQLWAIMQNDFGNALRDQAQRIDIAAGATLVDDAITAYRAAMMVFTKSDHPLDWAKLQNNLAILRRRQAVGVKGTAEAANLQEIVIDLRAASKLFDEVDQPRDWAGAQHNLGNALCDLAHQVNVPLSTTLLVEAGKRFSRVLRVRTKVNYPLEWAATQDSLGNAYRILADRTEGEAAGVLMIKAVAAYDDSLKVRTQADFPVAWADTRLNLASTELAIGGHLSAINRLFHLRAALVHVELALTVYDPVLMARNHREASKLRDTILVILSNLNP